MATEREYQQRLDQFATLLGDVARRLGSATITDPTIADTLVRDVSAQLEAWKRLDDEAPAPADLGLAQLAGIGPDAAAELGDTRIPQGVRPYDDEVSSEHIVAVADLYYIYQHERLGAFRAVNKLQELFRAGAVRLSSGEGAFGLYKWDRREVLRHTARERRSAYRRAFGYGRAPVPTGGRANVDFHPLFSQFANQVTLFWRDKRVSDVIRERAYDPSFGSIAVVRRAGLDLRNNLKFMAYGDVNVLRVEIMQLLDEAFRILGADDVKDLFGAASAWDVIEEVLVRYFNEHLVTSPRQRLAVTGRDMLRWLAHPYILQGDRAQFETALLDIAEDAEEWLTSAQALGLAVRTGTDRILPWGEPRRRVAPAVPAQRRPVRGMNGGRRRVPA